jgi:transcriptional regulator with XRE-family HTH domain
LKRRTSPDGYSCARFLVLLSFSDANIRQIIHIIIIWRNKLRKIKNLMYYDMTPKEQRLKEVYEHLRANHGIHTKTDFAEALHVTRPALSSAMNGNEHYLTKNLFQKICGSFPGVFNLNYLLTGEGNLLAMSDHEPEKQERADTPPTDEMSANILELYARMIRGVDDLRIQLKEELAEVQSVKCELQQARDDFQTATRRLYQAIERIDSSYSTSIGIAADEQEDNRRVARLTRAVAAAAAAAHAAASKDADAPDNSAAV